VRGHGRFNSCDPARWRHIRFRRVLFVINCDCLFLFLSLVPSLFDRLLGLLKHYLVLFYCLLCPHGLLVLGLRYGGNIGPVLLKVHLRGDTVR
jgi:hypothetical protein